MHQPKPIPEYGPSIPSTAGRKVSVYVMFGLLGIFLLVSGSQAFDHFRTELRMRHQVKELKAMLATKGVGFRHVYVFGGSTSGEVFLVGYVRTNAEASQLRSEMVARLGAEVGKTVYCQVQVVPPGTVMLGDNVEFWTKLEQK